MWQAGKGIRCAGFRGKFWLAGWRAQINHFSPKFSGGKHGGRCIVRHWRAGIAANGVSIAHDARRVKTARVSAACGHAARNSSFSAACLGAALLLGSAAVSV